jgi:hypothetical protein
MASVRVGNEELVSRKAAAVLELLPFLMPILTPGLSLGRVAHFVGGDVTGSEGNRTNTLPNYTYQAISQISLDDGFALAVDVLSDVSRTMADAVTSSAIELAEISAAGDRIDRLNAENAETLRTLLEGV